MKIKFMEWNIHGSGGYNYFSIPFRMLMETISEINPDVLVLLEFIEYANGFVDLKYFLEKNDYSIHTTNYRTGGNGVLIAIKNSYKSEKVDQGVEYLEVNISLSSDNNENFNVIGTRILTQNNYAKFINRKKLFDTIMDKQIGKNFVLLFDANNGNIQFEGDKYFSQYKHERADYNYQQIWREVEDERKWSLITPKQGGGYIGGVFSIVTEVNRDKGTENYHTKEDHIISSFPKDKFSKVEYEWDFVKESNGYGKRTYRDYLSDLEGLPDHGVLVAELDLT